MSSISSKSDLLIDGLMKPETYPHQTYDIKLIETHISWVFLTGVFAYKLKKPIKKGFFDASSLLKRNQLCENEIILNKRFTKTLYLGKSIIIGTYLIPQVITLLTYKHPLDEEITLDVLVRMKQFNDSQLLINNLDNGKLVQPLIKDFAFNLAVNHLSNDSHLVKDYPFNVNDTLLPVIENIEQIVY